MSTLYAILIFSLPVIFITQMVMYDRLFYWRRSFQGKALMGQMIALNLLLLFQVLINFLRFMEIERGDWFRIIALLLFSVLAVTGVRFCFAIYNSREKIPRAK